MRKGGYLPLFRMKKIPLSPDSYREERGKG